MKMVWAVIRSDKVELIAQELNNIGVSGCTVYRVRGYGQQWRLYEPLIHGGHYKLEAIVEDSQVDRVTHQITENGSTGKEGDGVLAIFDLGSVINLRSKEQIKNS